MPVHTRGARKYYEPSDVRSSDNDFTVLFDRSSIPARSTPPPAPRSDPPPAPVSRRIERVPAPAPPRRDPATAEGDRPSHTRAVRSLRQELDESPTGPSVRRRERRVRITLLAIALLVIGGSIGAGVENAISRRAVAAGTQATSATVPAPIEPAVIAPPPAPPTLTTPAPDPTPAPSAHAHHHAHHATEAPRPAPTSSSPAEDTSATPDDFAAAADALAKAKQETTLP